MKEYDFKSIEAKWQEDWEKSQIYKTSDEKTKKKFYTLLEFPYPSGEGLHVGHVKGQTAVDIFARFKRMNGYNVLNAIGWDAFGLPAENFAIKNKQHPATFTQKNIDNFRRQIKSFGPSFDWTREIDTTDPEYYKWTQWIFLELFKAGLAYEKEAPINWCPSCKTGLANEEVIDGHCERCDSQVVQKLMKQWYLKITEYAEKLIDDLTDLNWPEYIKTSQKNWIGKSQGAEFEMKKSDDSTKSISVYTTRIDTVFGMTYAVIAPDYKGVNDFITEEKKAECEKYIDDSKKKSDMERTELAKEKTGVFTGSYVINPFNDKKIPVYIGDYVLGNYGTGAVMAVPAHDERDFEFAVKYSLDIVESIAPNIFCSGVSAPKKGYEVNKIDSITVIIKHWNEEKYLLLKFANGEYGLVGGKRENGEDKLETLKREVIEETGYTYFEIESILWDDIFGTGYKLHKDRVDEAHDKVFVVKLLNDKNVGISEEEKTKHNYEWFDKNEIANKITTIEHHKFYWNSYLQEKTAYTEDGILVNSGEFTGLKSEEAREKMTDWIEKEGIGKRKINYKLRDWLFSRQRYRGEPIPIVKCEKCGLVPVPENELPLLLPEVENYEPTGTGESPLAHIDSWVNTICPTCSSPAKRETNTMPQWAGSSWYFLRYIDPKNSKALASKENLEYFMPVDIYFGGAEHTTVHLLYSRFWNKVLFDRGIVPVSEPYKRRVQHGLIAGEDGRKMSKRWGNVINPDDVIKEFGADTMRTYIMFMGPYGDSSAWSTSTINGIHRFLKKVWLLKDKTIGGEKDEELDVIMHKSIKKLTDDIEQVSYHTGISQLMIFLNAINTKNSITREVYENFLKLLAPFAPHITEELWAELGNKTSIHISSWPTYDSSKLIDKIIKIAIQVNGKVRDEIEVEFDSSEEIVKEKAFMCENVIKYTTGNEIKKVVYVKNKLLSIVI